MKISTKKTNQLVLVVLILFISGHFFCSFIQHYNSPLFGDIDGGVLPNDVTEKIFDDPFGFNALQTGEKHVNPNRFFSHFLLSTYFKNVPLLLQKFADPISSVYLASALLKIAVQLIFVYILAAFISGTNNPFKRNFILISAVIVPLFQVYGYWSRMGIVDKSIAYTFFYAVPLVLLMVFFLPVFRTLINHKKLKATHYIILSPLIIILPFSGPLIPAVSVLVSFFIFLHYIFKYRKNGFKPTFNSIPIHIYLLLIPLSLWSLYSLFLRSLYDSNYQSEIIPVLERFSKLPEGVFSQVFHSLGFPLMLLMIGINVYFLKKKSSS